MKNYLILIIGIVIISSFQGLCQRNPKVDKKTKKINLVPLEQKPFFVYENSVSIIYLEKSLVLNSLRKNLENKELCPLRKANYTKIADRFEKDDSSFYVINPNLSPEILEGFGDIPDTDQLTGYFPLDYYTQTVKFSISTNFIPPYGYIPELDTSQMIRLEKYYEWMISELLLKGQAMVYNKMTKSLEKEIYYEVVHFEGHGGEQLLFSNHELFFIVDTYSDIITPDYECGDDYEGYNKNE